MHLDKLCSSMILAFVLIGCGPDTASFDVPLRFGDENSAASEIFSNFQGLVTARVMWSYEGLQPGVLEAYRVEPPRARPTILPPTTPDGGDTTVFTTLWSKAGSSGLNPFESGSVKVSGVPTNVKRFRLGVEFLLEYREAETGQAAYFAVAYACFVGPDGEISEEQLQSALSQGLEIFAGRTCGRCPIVEDPKGQDMPGFTVAELNEEAPDLCP